MSKKTMRFQTFGGKTLQTISSFLLLTPLLAQAVAVTGIDISTCTNIRNVVTRIANFGAGIVTTVAVIVFLVAAYYFLFGAASEDAQKKGRQYLIFGIVGIIVALIAFTLPTLVTNVLGLSATCT